MTYRVSQCVAQTTGSLHLALGKVRGTRKAPRVSEARDIARGRHTHLYHQNSLTTSKKNKPTNTNPLFDGKQRPHDSFNITCMYAFTTTNAQRHNAPVNQTADYYQVLLQVDVSRRYRAPIELNLYRKSHLNWSNQLNIKGGL